MRKIQVFKLVSIILMSLLLAAGIFELNSLGVFNLKFIKTPQSAQQQSSSQSAPPSQNASAGIINPQSLNFQNIADQPAVNSGDKSSAIPQTASQQSLDLAVPFTAQAPFGVWDLIHNESCEEASALMAADYFSENKSTAIPAADADKDIIDLNNWEVKNFGYSLDTTSQETAQMIQSVYGLKTRLIENFTADDLKQALLAGNLVMISEDGRLLNNPHYKQPGPVHHMLLVRGYNSQGFLVNDPGTRYGNNYFYSFDTLKNAAADWDHPLNTVNQNKKIAIIVSK